MNERNENDFSNFENEATMRTNVCQTIVLHLHTVKLVASKVGALNVLVKDRKSIIVQMEKVSASTVLLKNLKSFKLIQMTRFLLDFLIIMKKLFSLSKKKTLSFF